MLFGGLFYFVPAAARENISTTRPLTLKNILTVGGVKKQTLNLIIQDPRATLECVCLTGLREFSCIYISIRDAKNYSKL